MSCAQHAVDESGRKDKRGQLACLARGASYRGDFPLLRDSNVVYLDSAASTQKPESVLSRMDEFYRTSYSNVHRGSYSLSTQATEAYEAARERAAQAIGAPDPRTIVFTRGATESINLVAYAWAQKNLGPGDEILITILEHHANFVPWKMLEQQGIVVRVIGLDAEGRLDLDEYTRRLSPRTKLAAFTQLSNVLGARLPIVRLTREAHEYGALVLVDGAQGFAHGGVDVSELDVDFYVFSGHKVYGPTGIGVLYAKQELLEAMTPFQYGGDMIDSVSVDRIVFNEVPHKFEAGTPNIVGAVGLHAALDYVEGLGSTALARHEQSLVEHLEHSLHAIPEVRILGPAGGRIALVSFTIDGVHAHDAAQFLSDVCSVAVRAGHHCAQPLQEALGVSSSLRASLGIYNTAKDVVRLAEGITRAVKFFRPNGS